MLFKISPIQTLISATTVFNHSSVIFDPTELCLTILESLGRGKNMVSLNLSEKDSIKNESFYKVLKEVAVEKKADLRLISAFSMS